MRVTVAALAVSLACGLIPPLPCPAPAARRRLRAASRLSSPRLSAKKPDDADEAGPLSFIGDLFKPAPAKKPSESDALIDSMLKDAPLPIKALGGLFKGVASMAVKAVEGMAADSAAVVDAVERALKFSPEAVDALGDTIECGMPLSTSMSSVQGAASTANVQLPVTGSMGSGMVMAQATIDPATSTVSLGSVSLRVGSRTIDVLASGGGSVGDDDVIDV